jgi:hypothetical protein
MADARTYEVGVTLASLHEALKCYMAIELEKICIFYESSVL